MLTKAIRRQSKGWTRLLPDLRQTSLVAVPERQQQSAKPDVHATIRRVRKTLAFLNPLFQLRDFIGKTAADGELWAMSSRTQQPGSKLDR